MSPSELSPQGLLFPVDAQRPQAVPYSSMRGIEPSSRHDDPTSSYMAADTLKRTGIAGRQRVAVFHALRKHQGLTSAELARVMECDRYTPSRRLPELAKSGWVVRGRRRRCTVTGIVSETWWIVRGWGEGNRDSSPVPSRAAGGGKTRTSSEVREPARVTTPEERQQLRERLAASGDSLVRKFLSGVTPGGAK